MFEIKSHPACSIMEKLIQSDGLDIENFYDLPCHVYWKDRKGIYGGCNDYEAKDLGLNTKDVIGNSDMELPWGKGEAEFFQLHDKEVMRKNVPMLFKEYGTLPNVGLVEAISYKMPLRNAKKVIGIFGLSFPSNSVTNELSLNNGIANSLMTNLSKFSDKRISYLDRIKIGDVSLSKRESECLYHSTRGKTVKRIACVLGISSRTVEHYLNNVKSKMGVSYKSELIEKTISYFY